ncbi:unnamed protein product [Symbiodinium sp. CCMP2456]|nr:unnamed protein product [Symbiodinium sp. CCMP2456]
MFLAAICTCSGITDEEAVGGVQSWVNDRIQDVGKTLRKKGKELTKIQKHYNAWANETVGKEKDKKLDKLIRMVQKKLADWFFKNILKQLVSKMFGRQVWARSLKTRRCERRCWNTPKTKPDGRSWSMP